MDSRSHNSFADVLLQRSGHEQEYAVWGTCCDIDLRWLTHRYGGHKISSLPTVYDSFIALYPGVPKQDKLAVALCFVSHNYLDMFSAYVFSWGLRLPVIHVPKEIAKEYLEDMHYDLLHGETDEQVREFHDQSRKLFEMVPDTMSTQETLSSMLYELSKRTFDGGAPIAAMNMIAEFAGVRLTYSPRTSLSKFTDAYYRFINDFFAKW